MVDEPLGNVVIKLGLDNSKFGSELTRSKQLVKYATAEMKANFSAMGAGGNKVAALTAKQKGLNTVIQAQQREVAALKKRYDESIDSNGKASKGTAKYATELQNAQGKLGSMKNQLAETAKAAAKARVETSGFTGVVNNLSKGTVAVGGKMSSAGSTMTRSFTVPIVAGLGAAVKAAVDFDSQISSMGPLLTNGGKVTKQFQQQLDKLGESSKNWSKQYGISTTEINNAMSELIKRGFTAQQTLGSMPSILDATKASGEDLGTVMNATASIMEQFGLKGKTTEETLANTQRVTDSLTYAANATASGFGDMSEAMSYVGPVAKSLNLSVEDTAAAIGVLSNQGIEGQKAGTNLRGILTSLVKVTPNAAKELKKMGISTKEAARDASDLPQLIDDITSGTKGWTAADKGKAMATVFGKQNQAAMNSLIEAGSGALRDLTKDTESATGATKKIADQMNNTKANQIKRATENIKQMGITIGQKLLPLLPPVLDEINGLLDGFSNLDEGTQTNIIKWVALTAAMGPVLSVSGKMLTTTGRLGGGMVDLVSKVEQWRSGQAALKGVTDASATATTALGTATETSAGKVSAFSALLSPTGLALAGVAGAIGLTGLAFKTWQDAYGDSSQRAKRWGSDVGKSANDSLVNIQNASTKASDALNGFGKGGVDAAKDVKTAFEKMYKVIEGDNKSSVNAMQKTYDAMPPAAQAAYDKTLVAQKKAASQRTKQAADINKTVNDITTESISSGQQLTADQQIVLSEYVDRMQKISVDSLNVTAKQRKQIMKALKGDYSDLDKNELGSLAGHFQELFQTSAKGYKKVADNLKDQYAKGQITKLSYNKSMEALDNDFMLKNGKTLDARVKAMRAYGMSDTAIWAAVSRETGMSVGKIKGLYSDWAETTTENTAIASAAGNKAAKDWNAIVLDPKTGKVKTNAQEEVTKAAKSKEGWDNLVYDLHHADLSTNAKAILLEATIQSGNWNKLTFKEQKLLATTNTAETVMQALMDVGAWNSFSPATQQLFAKDQTQAALQSAMTDMGIWQRLDAPHKDLLAKAKTAADVKKALSDIQGWKNLDPKIKNLIAKDYASANASAATKAVREFANLQDTIYKTVKVQYQQSGRQGALNAIQNRNNQFANGTPTGGARSDMWAMVNDQKGPNFRELIQYPNGTSIIPQGRNQILPITRDTVVYPASKTKRMFPGIKQYVQGKDVPANADIINLTNVASNTISPSPDTAIVDSLIAISRKNEDKINSMIGLLQALLQKDSDVYIDKQKVGQVIEPVITKVQATQTKINNRRRGYI